MKEKLVTAIADMREDEALQLAKEMLDAGANPQEVLDAGRDAMAIVGERYDHKEYFLPELIIAGDMLKAIGELVMPLLKDAAATTEPKGKVVIGTVAGDIHDIGKDIVGFMLEVNDYTITDLGVDVAAEKFVAAVRDEKPQIVAMSGFLTLAYDEMKNVVEALKEAGLRDSIKIMIGGAPMSDDAAMYIGADAFGKDATAAVKLANGWIGGK
jgi:methanogenic corrinoid protein MtbC1